MGLPFTHKRLTDWAGPQVVKDAESLVDRGLVLQADFVDPLISGAIRWNNRDLKTAMRLRPDGTVESQCPCYANIERGVICAHVIALAIVLVKRHTDPQREAKHREEARRASRMASIDESAYIKRVPKHTTGSQDAEVFLTLDEGWLKSIDEDGLPLSCAIAIQGKRIAATQVPRSVPLSFSKEDEALLYVLEDICEGPLTDRMLVKRSDFINILKLRSRTGSLGTSQGAITVNQAPMKSHVRVELDRETGELILMVHTELPYLRPVEFPAYIVAGSAGWAYGAGNFWPLESVLPLPYHGLYAEPVIVPRENVLGFFRHEYPNLEKYAPVESDVSFDLLTIDPATPEFRLVLRGSAASISATLYARYGGTEMAAGKRDPKEQFSIPDPADLLRYLVRNREAEAEALRLLSAAGISGENGDTLSSLVGRRDVLNFLAQGLPSLKRQGWTVDVEGRISSVLEEEVDFATPVVHLKDQGGWFDVTFNIEAPDGASLSPADVQRALLRGDAYMDYKGRPLLIDSGAVKSMQDVFADCLSDDADQSGHFRLSNVYASYVKASLDALDGVDVEDTPQWRMQADKGNRSLEITPVTLPPAISALLRGYQRDGIHWLCFLERNGFSGLLADEMGLGKTLQTLVWLSLERLDPNAQGKPCLIVCPTSIVDNWAAEAQRFVPNLKVMTVAGPDRHECWAKLGGIDLAITSYALIRRDLDRYLEFEFAVIVLDEAQHIKNRSTQNAQAARKLRAHHRLVLTGTPVENSVSDLWSIMDFLMPGYLGTHKSFHQNYELAMARGGPESADLHTRLRRKLKPFMLRRLKKDVARDLPPKIEKISLCPLSADQRVVYSELLQRSRDRISQMVSQRGFNACRMEILTTLTRLRQVCCHLDLLKLPNLKAEFPSGKMELFFELLDEAMDGGHRVLVFSQFVTMLQILKKEIEARGLSYCYLDGSTKDRMQVVQQFNRERDIPLFLISLKAGGTGLNLTGADMVIHFDPWWNPAVENQATDRAYRIGQKRTVYSVKLIASGTVEEKVLALQQRKQILINNLVDSDEEVMQKMTWDDVQELLTL